MTAVEPTSTHQKALSINLDATSFGSFAEIGAGQEVARWFLKVGAASGTVAKTISAYDKEVSDDLYGAGTRYVSRPRLQAMIEREWSQLLAQLDAMRGAATRFFSFVDTISARNFAGTNECHGWIGIRFQTQPRGPANDVILHVNLGDNSNLAQQDAVGIFGVNLIHAVFHHLNNPEEFLAQLVADLPLDRVEIDCVDLKGPAFAQWNVRVVQAQLVANGHAVAVLFPADDVLVPPTEILYKKTVVLAPGVFDVVEPATERFIGATQATLPKEDLELSKGSLGLFCLVSDRTTHGEPPLTAEQIVERVDSLKKLGRGVLVFRERELYKMGAFVKRYTKARIHFAAGLPILLRTMRDRYKDLDGALLEGIARLFHENIRLNVFPLPSSVMMPALSEAAAAGWKWKEANSLVGAKEIEPPEPLNHLYRYLIGNGFILPMEG